MLIVMAFPKGSPFCRHVHIALHFLGGFSWIVDQEILIQSEVFVSNFFMLFQRKLILIKYSSDSATNIHKKEQV